MPDSRYEPGEDSEPEPEIPHIISMTATIDLHWTGTAWEITDPAVLHRDDYSIICTHGLHLDNAAAGRRCELEKERANGAPMPSRKDARDAFDRAAVVAEPILGI